MTTHWMPLAAFMALVIAGCSFSHSSKSFSESSASSSRSSSGDDADETAYRDDVRDETLAFVASGEEIDAFQASLGEVARRHGIVDWEASRTTYVAIGQGLAKAQIRGERLATLEQELIGSDSARQRAFQQGYESIAR